MTAVERGVPAIYADAVGEEREALGDLARAVRSAVAAGDLPGLRELTATVLRRIEAQHGTVGADLRLSGGRRCPRHALTHRQDDQRAA